MHRQRSKETLFSLRVRAFFFLFNLCLLLLSTSLLIGGLIIHSQKTVNTGGLGLIFASLSSLTFYALSFRWKCPLCMGAVWSRTKCRRNKNAVKFLGLSYRIGVAFSVLLTRPYRCPFCGEKFSSAKTRT